MLTVQNESGVILAYLNNLETGEIHEALNGEYTLSFIATIDPLKTEFLYAENNLIEYENDLFRVMQFEELHAEDNALTIAVTAVHISYDLIANQFNDFIYTYKSASEVMIQCLMGTDFTLIGTDVTLKTDIQYTEQCNSKQISIAIANNWQGELKYYRHDIQLLQQRGQNRGVDFRFGKNLKSIKRTKNFAENTISYEVDVQQGAELEELGYFELGDTIRVIDDALNTDHEVRIIDVKKDIVTGMNSNIVLGDEIKDLRSSFSSVKKMVEETKQIIADSAKDWNKINLITDNVGNVILGKLNAITQLSSKIINTTGTFEQKDNGQYWQDQPTLEASTFATFWGATGILFANTKGAQGAWIWKSALDADGLTATKIVASALYGLTMDAVTLTSTNITSGDIGAVNIEGASITGGIVYSGDVASGNYVKIEGGAIQAYVNNIRIFQMTTGENGKLHLNNTDGTGVEFTSSEMTYGVVGSTVKSTNNALVLACGSNYIKIPYSYLEPITIQGDVAINGNLYSNNLG